MLRRDEPLGFGSRVLAAVALLPLAAFTWGTIALLGHVVEGTLWELLPLPAAAALTAGSFAVIVLAARIVGTKRFLEAAEAWRTADVDDRHGGPPLDSHYERDRRRYGAAVSPAGRGVMEVAALPALMFLPVAIVFWDASFGDTAVGTAALLVGLFVSVVPLALGLYGQAGIALGAMASAWLPWIILVTTGWPLIGTVIGFVAGVVSCVFSYRGLSALRRRGESANSDA